MMVFITKKMSFDAKVGTLKFVWIGYLVVCDLKFLSHMTTYLGVHITQVVYQVVDQVNICKNWTV
jgi:hypothetical protein